MLYFLLFLSELILLFVLSKKLVNSLARIIFRLTKSRRAMVNILAIIFLPGTIIHELAHLLFAGVMMVPVGELNVVPEVDEKGVKLGSVQIGKTDPFRRVIVGVAPVLLGLFCILAVFFFIPMEQGTASWWQTALGFYLIFEIGNTMFSSRKDIEGGILFVILILTLFIVASAALYFLNPALLQTFWIYLNQVNLEFAVNFFKQADIYLIIPLALDMLIILITKLLF